MSAPDSFLCTFINAAVSATDNGSINIEKFRAILNENKDYPYRADKFDQYADQFDAFDAKDGIDTTKGQVVLKDGETAASVAEAFYRKNISSLVATYCSAEFWDRFEKAAGSEGAIVQLPLPPTMEILTPPQAKELAEALNQKYENKEDDLSLPKTLERFGFLYKDLFGNGTEATAKTLGCTSLAFEASEKKFDECLNALRKAARAVDRNRDDDHSKDEVEEFLEKAKLPRNADVEKILYYAQIPNLYGKEIYNVDNLCLLLAYYKVTGKVPEALGNKNMPGLKYDLDTFELEAYLRKQLKPNK